MANLTFSRLIDFFLMAVIPVLLVGMHFNPAKYDFDFNIAQPLSSIEIHTLWTVHFVHEPVFREHLAGSLLVYPMTVVLLYILICGHGNPSSFRRFFLGTFLLITPLSALITLLGFPITFETIHPSTNLPTGSHHGFSDIVGVFTGGLFVASLKVINQEISEEFTTIGIFPIVFWIAFALVPFKYVDRFDSPASLAAISLIAGLAGTFSMAMTWRVLGEERDVIWENITNSKGVAYWTALGLLMVTFNLFHLLPLIPFLDGVNHLGHVGGVILGICWAQLVFHVEEDMEPGMTE